MSSGPGRYAQSLQTTLRSTAAAYGYTLTTATTMGVLTSVHGKPQGGRLFAFITGGLVAFTVLEGVLQLLGRFDADEPVAAFPFAGALSFFSVALGLGAATALADGVRGDLAWGLAPAASTAAYMLGVAAQVTLLDLARRRLRRFRERDGSGRSSE